MKLNEDLCVGLLVYHRVHMYNLVLDLKNQRPQEDILNQLMKLCFYMHRIRHTFNDSQNKSILLCAPKKVIKLMLQNHRADPLLSL
ncbi:unnamed protein product [Trichogramma brassicae]|uniref:Uncharacterized protein n=1 Tax=Trichogramma brassicae TaxID=86971 RepID=A0A6H5IW26_9HYME|nr:unnamed protein product [Trichogramma brassicae]